MAEHDHGRLAEVAGRVRADLAAGQTASAARTPPILRVLAALFVMLVGTAAMALAAWLSGYSEMQIGMSCVPGFVASMLVANGVVGWSARAPMESGPLHTRLTWLARAVLVFVGLCIFAAGYVLVPIVV